MPLRLLLILVIAAAVLAGAAAWAVTGRRAGATIAAVLREPSDVREGAPVLFHGARVGTVRTVQRSDSGVLLTIRLERGDLPLRADDRVAVRSPEHGTDALLIVPSASASRRWRPGDVLQPAPASGP